MDGVLMWSHYADSHRGFLIGFDSEDPSIRNRKDGERYLLEVKYTDQRPRFETLEGFSREQLFCTKSKEWTYESEWQLFDKTSHADVSDPFSLFKFDPAAVREVILGARMQKGVRTQILAILARPDYLHVNVRQAELHRSEYRVEAQDVPQS